MRFQDENESDSGTVRKRTILSFGNASPRNRRLSLVLRFLKHRWRRIRPVEIEAAVLNRCNLRCAYCRYPEIPKAELSTAQWADIIRGFARLGALRFKLHGGEPTLRPDFGELAAEVRAAGMISAAVTNGTIIPGRPELLDHLDELVVSLDSTRPEINDRLRGPGVHGLAVRTIDLALGRGVRTYLNTVLTKANLEDIDSLLAFCRKRGLRMNAQPIVFGSFYYESFEPGLALTEDEIRDAHDRLLRAKLKGEPLLFSKQSYRTARDWPDHRILAVRSADGTDCVAGREYIRIESNGDVIPCCQYNADFVPKNILRDGLEESLAHVQTHNCGRCWLAYYNERNALYKFRPDAVRETLRRA